MPANGRACGRCANFEPDQTVPGTGECRAGSPDMDMLPVTDERTEDVSFGNESGVITVTSIDQVDVTRRAIWPRVYSDAWCGDFEQDYGA